MRVVDEAAVMPCAELGLVSLRALREPRGLRVAEVADDLPIPGSYLGDREAGLIADTLYVRGDTPVHSALHEACHWLCADATRRQSLHTNAGGEDVEEHAVCYLQCRLAAQLVGYSQARCFKIGRASCRERVW